jgi:hypothetical protein
MYQNVVLHLPLLKREIILPEKSLCLEAKQPRAVENASRRRGQESRQAPESSPASLETPARPGFDADQGQPHDVLVKIIWNRA